MKHTNNEWYIAVFAGTVGNFSNQIILADSDQTIFRDYFRDEVDSKDAIRVIKKGIELRGIPKRIFTSTVAALNNADVWAFLASQGIEIYTSNTVNQHIAKTDFEEREGLNNTLYWHIWANKTKVFVSVLIGEDVERESIALQGKDLYKEVCNYFENLFSGSRNIPDALVCLTPARIDENRIIPTLNKFGIKYHKYLSHPEFEKSLKKVEDLLTVEYYDDALEIMSDMIECHLRLENQE